MSLFTSIVNFFTDPKGIKTLTDAVDAKIPLPTSPSTGNALIWNGTAWVAKSGAAYNGTPADPTGTTSATAKMMGLGGAAKFTPARTGTVIVSITGIMNTSGAAVTAAINMTVQARTGTGTAPSNGGNDAGTARGKIRNLPYDANEQSVLRNLPFSCNFVLTGLTIGTEVWVDLAVARVGGTSETVSVSDLAISILEQ